MISGLDFTATVIANLPQIVAAVAAVAGAISSFHNRKKLTKVQIMFNGRVDELVASKIAESEARGFARGLAEAVARENDIKKLLEKKMDGGDDI